MRSFPLISSTLQGVFSAGAGHSAEEAASALERDLRHPALRDGLALELREAFADSKFSWCALLSECDVAYVDSEQEAVALAESLFQQVAL